MKNLGTSHENLDHKAYLIVKTMIFERRLLPGEKIPQEKLAHELGISRTPLIGALKFLEKEQLVEARPRRGFFVRLFNDDEIVSIFELREVLEGLAARRAAESISDAQIETLKLLFKDFDASRKITDIKTYAKEDRRFHNYVVDVSPREFLKSIHETYNFISYSYQFDSDREGLVRPPDDTITEHRAIIDAICRRDALTAEELMRRHLGRTIAYIKKDLAGSKNTNNSSSS